MRMAVAYTIALLLIVSSLSTVADAESEFDFTVEVPPGKFQCYFQSVTDKRHKTLEVDYQVIDGGDLNINFMVLLGADILVQDLMKVDGTHKIEVKELGDYQICFDNSFAYQSRKVVFFEIFLFDEHGNLDQMDAKKLGGAELSSGHADKLGVTIGEFHASSTRIKGFLNKIEYHQALLRAYEARDRAVMNANLDRVTFWSIANSVVLLVVGGIQVFMIRSLFEDTSKVGRLLRHPRS